MPIVIQKRNQYWFGRYCYQLRLSVNEASTLRGMDHDRIDRIIRVRREWGRKLGPTNPGSWRHSWAPIVITDRDLETLHILCDFFNNESRDHKIMVSGNSLFVYSSDIKLIQDLCDLEILNNSVVSIAQIDLKGQKNAVNLQSSMYSKRLFFKNRSLSAEKSVTLGNFLSHQSDIRIGPSLKHWLKSYRGPVKDYFFLDYNNDSIVSMLSLVCPDIIRKTLPIVVDK